MASCTSHMHFVILALSNTGSGRCRYDDEEEDLVNQLPRWMTDRY